jgi:hypothetical protein
MIWKNVPSDYHICLQKIFITKNIIILLNVYNGKKKINTDQLIEQISSFTNFGK